MRFVLPLPVNLGNARMYWRKKTRLKRDYGLECTVAMRLKWPVRGEPWKRATISAHFYVWNLMDDDNAMARLKWPLDWLVTSGYIVDDSRKVLTWSGLPEQTIDRKNQRLVITLEEA